MASSNGRILVKSIEFGKPPFRKLGGLKIDFAERITLIAGHNGIGKSTILGLLTNTFGITTSEPKSYFGESYFKNIEKIVYLAVQEAVMAKEHPTSAPVVVSLVGDVTVRKRCAMTQRTKWNRARVVPRTVDKAKDDPVGQDAKVPLPTIYLGIRRLASIGEADELDVSSGALTMHSDDARIMVEFVRSVIAGVAINNQLTQTSIKSSGKLSIQPGFDAHDAMAISVGQDSLGSIATALASFSRLKRDQGSDYRGGLLVIDEIDVGFHPHALRKLSEALKTYARRLNLQIVATTHSPALIECIHPEGKGAADAPDSVVYLLDTNTPRLADDQSLPAILDDMSLKQDLPQKTVKPKLGIYFEDSEAVQLFDALYPVGKRRAMSRKNGITLVPIALEVGGSNLLKLPENDPIFRDRVLVVDADTKVTAKAKSRGNVAKLPCPAKSVGTARSPENMIIAFLKAMMDANDGPYYNSMLDLEVKNPSSDKIRDAFFSTGGGLSSDREATKKWWVSHWDKIKAWEVLQVWAKHHSAEVEAFILEFEMAVVRTATRVR